MSRRPASARWSTRADLGGARYVEGRPGRCRDDRPDRRRRVGQRLEPARAGGVRRPGRARWRDRARLRRPRLPGARLGGRAGDRDGAGAGRRRRDAGRDARRRPSPMSSSWPATCGSSVPRCWPASAAGSSTPTRRCCRPSRGRMPWPMRWPTASPSPAAPSTSSTPPSTAARSWRRRRSRSCPTTTPTRCMPGSGRSSTACCRGPWRSCWPAPSGRRARRAARPRRPRAGRRPVPVPRRALLSVSDKTGLVDFAGGLVRAGFELVSTGGTARALRDAGLPVTDVAAVTGFPEMLDGRVKTLHPRVHGGILADRRLADHRRQLLAAAIAPFELVVVNLYPFAAAAERPGITVDELVEEIDIGGPSMVRAAAKNHASVAIVTSPARYDAVLAALAGEAGVGDGLRSRAGRRGLPPHRRLRRPDRRGPAGRMGEAGVPLPDEPACPGRDPYPASLTVALEKVETLRYGENPHQPAARYRRPGSGPADGPFAERGTAAPGQGAVLQQRARRLGRGRARAGAARPGRGHRQAHQPVRRRRARDAPGGLAGRAGRRPGLGLRRRGRPDPRRRRGLWPRPSPRSSSRSSSRPAFDEAARAILAAQAQPAAGRRPGARPRRARAGAGPDRVHPVRRGAVLVTAPDTVPDDPAAWTVATRREPTPSNAATSTSPGGWSGASARTRSCWSGTAA